MSTLHILRQRRPPFILFSEIVDFLVVFAWAPRTADLADCSAKQSPINLRAHIPTIFRRTPVAWHR